MMIYLWHEPSCIEKCCHFVYVRALIMREILCSKDALCKTEESALVKNTVQYVNKQTADCCMVLYIVSIQAWFNCVRLCLLFFKNRALILGQNNYFWNNYWSPGRHLSTPKIPECTLLPWVCSIYATESLHEPEFCRGSWASETFVKLYSSYDTLHCSHILTFGYYY